MRLIRYDDHSKANAWKKNSTLLTKSTQKMAIMVVNNKAIWNVLDLS